MRLRWCGANAVCDGRLRETGATYDDFADPAELLRRGIVAPLDDEAQAVAAARVGGTAAPDPDATVVAEAPTHRRDRGTED